VSPRGSCEEGGHLCYSFVCLRGFLAELPSNVVWGDLMGGVGGYLGYG
jgi:hypothetical protein